MKIYKKLAILLGPFLITGLMAYPNLSTSAPAGQTKLSAVINLPAPKQLVKTSTNPDTYTQYAHLASHRSGGSAVTSGSGVKMAAAQPRRATGPARARPATQQRTAPRVVTPPQRSPGETQYKSIRSVPVIAPEPKSRGPQPTYFHKIEPRESSIPTPKLKEPQQPPSRGGFNPSDYGLPTSEPKSRGPQSINPRDSRGSQPTHFQKIEPKPSSLQRVEEPPRGPGLWNPPTRWRP